MILCLTEVEWREVDEYWTPETIWPRNRTCPNEGEIRWCQTHYCETEIIAVGQKRWLLFQTGNSLLNGLGDSVEELDALTLIEAEILCVESGTNNLAFDGGSQWLQVRCWQVVPFALIPNRLPMLAPTNLDSRISQDISDCASEKLFLYRSQGSQVVTTEIYANDGSTSGPTHYIYFSYSLSNECEIYNRPLK